MRKRTILRHLPGILALLGGLLLAACGDNTSVPTTAPTTSAATTALTTQTTTTGPATTAALTSPAGTTARVTTAAPSTALATTAVATTVAGTTASATTVPAQGQAGSGKAAGLLANIPNTPDYLKAISYNNYAALRKLISLPDDATFQTISQDKEAFAAFNRGLFLMNATQIASLNYIQSVRDMAGFDVFQIDYDAEAGEPPNLISMAQGRFDYAAIDKAWLAAGTTRGKAGSGTSYTNEKQDVASDLQRIFIGPNALVAVPDQKLLIYGKPPAAAATVAGELPSKNPITANPAVKSLLDVFGDPLSMYMGTSIIASGTNLPVNISPGAAKDTLEATIKARQPVPTPVLGGFAFYQETSGNKFYMVANYYADEASAKAAQPILEDQLKNGTSQRTRTAYSKYWEVASSEVRGNLLVFKLNWKVPNGLTQFVFSRDFPAFTV